MEVQDYVRIVQSRWRIIALATVVGLLAALAASLVSTRCIRRPPACSSRRRRRLGQRGVPGKPVLAAARRVVHQARNGEDVLQDAIESRGLDLTPSDLGGRVKATAVPDTVLFDISVLDAKPELARIWRTPSPRSWS